MLQANCSKRCRDDLPRLPGTLLLLEATEAVANVTRQFLFVTRRNDRQIVSKPSQWHR
jgi:hypothetical protein